jgi:hypothetical protein
MRTIRVVRRAEIWSDGRLFWVAVGLGAVAALPVWPIARVAEFLLDAFSARLSSILIIERIVLILLVMFALFPFAWLFVRRGWQVLALGRAMVLGTGYAAGFSLCVLAVALAAARPPPSYPEIVANWWAIYLGVLGLFLFMWVLTPVAAILCNFLGPRYARQDGTLCPQCAYCLIGNESMICPECGRPFTFDELDTTEAEFREKVGPRPPSR